MRFSMPWSTASAKSWFIGIGEVESPLPFGSGIDGGELRLQSDFAIARDPRTACEWQGFVNEQNKMADAFKTVMAKLALVGQDSKDFVDCSEVVPIPVPALNKPARYFFSIPLLLSSSILNNHVVSPRPRPRRIFS